MGIRNNHSSCPYRGHGLQREDKWLNSELHDTMGMSVGSWGGHRKGTPSSPGAQGTTCGGSDIQGWTVALEEIQNEERPRITEEMAVVQAVPPQPGLWEGWTGAGEHGWFSQSSEAVADHLQA